MGTAARESDALGRESAPGGARPDRPWKRHCRSPPRVRQGVHADGGSRTSATARSRAPRLLAAAWRYRGTTRQTVGRSKPPLHARPELPSEALRSPAVPMVRRLFRSKLSPAAAAATRHPPSTAAHRPPRQSHRRRAGARQRARQRPPDVRSRTWRTAWPRRAASGRPARTTRRAARPPQPTRPRRQATPRLPARARTRRAGSALRFRCCCHGRRPPGC